MSPDAALSEAESRALAAIKSRVPGAAPELHLPEVPPSRIPRHIAVIMDGNGRWAEERGFPREFGHRNGATSVRAALTRAGDLGVEYLTLYSFSSENWRRPDREVAALMELCVAYCEGEREHLLRENVRVRVIGSREGLPPEVCRALDTLESATAACTGCTLCLAINYGSRAEIAGAARKLAEDVTAGRLDAAEIDESAIADRLDTAGIPDPDLLVRTGGELRLSNYLLWQLSYAEIYVTETLWPDFGPGEFDEAVRVFAARKRRFGGLDAAATLSESGSADGRGDSHKG